MAKASPTFGVFETTRFGGCIIPSDLAVATPKCGYCTGMVMITGLMARFTAFFNSWQQWASGGDGIPQILIVQWTNVAALCVHSYDMRKVVRNRCNLLDFAIEPALLTYRVDD